MYCINSHYQFAHSTALPASPPGICEFRLSSRSPSRRATERRLNGHGRTGGAFPVRTPVPCSSTIPHHGPPLLSPTNLRAPSSHQARTKLAPISHQSRRSCTGCGTLGRRRKAWWGVTCTVGAPWASVALSGTQWHSVALSGTQWHSVALRRHQMSSGVTCTVGTPSLRAQQREGRVLSPRGGAPVLFRHCDELGHEDVHLMRDAIRR